MKSGIRLLFFGVLIWFWIGCSQKQNHNNEHTSAPHTQGSVTEERVSSLRVGLDSLSTSRGVSLDSLRDFFQNYLTIDYLKGLGVSRDPEELRDLSQYHRLFHQYSVDHPEQQSSLSQLSYDYYRRLLQICADDFQTCPTLGLYISEVYAGNVFLLAEPLVAPDEMERFIQFTTSIGFPQNNRPLLQKRLQWMVDDISDDNRVDIGKIQRMTNLIVYLSIEGGSFSEQPVQVLFHLTQNNPNDSLARAAFEKILRISLEEGSVTSESILKSYVLNRLQQADLEPVLQMQNDKGLIRWKSDLKSFSKSKDWQLFYILQGFLNSKFTGELHSFLFSQKLIHPEDQKQLLDIALSYVYKKFVQNAYYSHEQMGQIWQEEFNRFGKVEPMMFEFLRRADATLADIWNVSYKRDVEKIVTELTPFYSSEELKPLKQVESHLEANIRNIVAYPTQFIMGYFASLQGDFDFKFFVISGFMSAMLIHMNDSYFFKEHFDGQAPVMFDFINNKNIEALEALQSFYVSLDEKVLKSYDLDMDFAKIMMSNYLRKEKQFILGKEEEMRRAFSTGTVVQRYLEYCEKIDAKDFNFSYNLPFQSAENRFFVGQVFPIGGGYSFGTSSEMVDFIDVFNHQLLRKNLSESMEQVRMEMGIKLNRMQLMHRAFVAQGNTSLAEELQKQIDDAQSITQRFFQDQEQKFVKMANCLVTLDSTEEKMRIDFFKRELSFAKGTYYALKILNARPNEEITVAQARLMEPEAFNQSMLSELPSEGLFIEELNRVWLAIGNSFKTSIHNYHNRITPQLGFKKNINGRYAFFTNRFEQRFRLLEWMSSEKQGQDYPVASLSGLPRDYQELDVIFGKGEKHFFTLDMEVNETEKQYLFKHFSQNGFRRMGYATQYQLDGTWVWKTVLLNFAAIGKTKAYLQMGENFNYSQYKTLLKGQLQSHFQEMARFSDRLLDLMNINADEKMILQEVDANNFRRDNALDPGGARTPGNTLFFYDNLVDFINLGQYDVYFNVLVSHQLGLHPEFVPGLFGNGPSWDDGTDQNPIVRDWIPKADQGIDKPNGVQQVQQVDAELAFGRRKLRYYAAKNGRIMRDYEDTNLFSIDSLAQKHIFHDLFHTVMADRALIDAFVEWTDEKASNEPAKSYQLDLFHHRTPYQPEYILPSIRARYYDFRHQFDNETFNVFKDRENLAEEDGPQ